MDTPYIFDSDKTYLFLVDNLTALVAAAIDSVLLSGSGIIVATNNEKTQREMAQSVGIQAFHIPLIPSHDNRLFHENNMPRSLESLDDFKLFPLWKGLSIDRLRFWQINRGLLEEFLSKLNFDVLVADFNIHSPLSSVHESDRFDKMVLIKNGTLRTPEHIAFIERNNGRILSIISDKEIDKPFIAAVGSNPLIWVAEKEFEPPVDKEYGRPCIYYDKQYIWQFNMYVERLPLFQVVSLDERSIEMFPRCHNINTNILPVTAVTRPERLIMFAYDEQVIDRIEPKEVLIYDPYGANRAYMTSIGDDRVTINE